MICHSRIVFCFIASTLSDSLGVALNSEVCIRMSVCAQEEFEEFCDAEWPPANWVM